MTDEHVKGTFTRAEGKVEETAGKVTGNKEQEAHGDAKQVPISTDASLELQANRQAVGIISSRKEQ